MFSGFLSVDADELKSNMATLEVGEMNSEMEQLLAGAAQNRPQKQSHPQSQPDKVAEDFIHPVLFESDYRGYNIVKFKGIFYALDRNEGPVDVTEIKTSAKMPWFYDATPQGLKAIIAEKGKPQMSLFEKIAARIKKLTG